jgi:ABC-type phosphate transport system substrate-binding protein
MSRRAHSSETPTRRVFVRVLAACVFGAVFERGRRASASNDEFRVIVSARNPIESAPRDFVADAFLKRVSRWDDGEEVRPADLRPESPTRRAFSERVLKRSVAAVRNYWQQRIFSGRELPPPVLESEEAVVSYVATHRGAIGYVSPSARLQDVKVLELR